MNALQKMEMCEPLDRHRPNCPTCNLGMWLFTHVTTQVDQKKEIERRTYVCEVCGTSEVVRV
jgi:transcription elongation factor Elf1